MIGELRKMEIALPDSATNFILAQSIQMPAEKVFKLLAERDIYVRYFKLPGLEDKLRITIGTPEQNDQLLGAIRDILSRE